MNRKIVALLLAVMLVASSVSAFAAVVEINGTNYLDTADYAALEADIDALLPEYNEPTGKYEISSDGIWAINNVYAFSLDTSLVKSDKAYADMDDAAKKALLKANGSYKVVDQIVIALNVVNVEIYSLAELVAQGYTVVAEWDAVNQYLCTKGGKYYIVKVTAEHNIGNIAGENVIKTGPDAFYHYYTNYSNKNLINSVAFGPKSFGDGLNFDHSAAKALFTINVKYDANAWIQIRDDEGRLYPVAGASYNPAKNGYTLTLKAGDNTISWYGADGAGWHKAGSASSAAKIALDVNMTLETVAKDLAGNPFYTDRVDVRFDYIVKHSVANHTAADATASAPKTGDAGMAYMTLVALIVMAGAAVVVTRKVRNF